MSKLIDQFMSLEKKLEKAKLEKASLKGQMESIMNELKEVFDIDSIDEAKEQVQLYKHTIDEQEEFISKLISEANKHLGD